MPIIFRQIARLIRILRLNFNTISCLAFLGDTASSTQYNMKLNEHTLWAEASPQEILLAATPTFTDDLPHANQTATGRFARTHVVDRSIYVG